MGKAELEFSWKSTPDLLEVTANGRFVMAELLALCDMILARCKEGRHTCVLIDLRRMSGRITTMQRHQLGMSVAEKLGNKIRVAALYRRDEIDGMTSLSARNRGGVLGVFPEREEAIEWFQGKGCCKNPEECAPSCSGS